MTKIPLGKIAFTDKGAYSNTVKYGRFDFVVTEDSCYLSIKDENSGHPVTDTAWWRCLARGTQATEAAKIALAKATDAGNAASNAVTSSVRADNSAVNADNKAIIALAAAEEALGVIANADNVIDEARAQIASMKAAELALMSQALLAPSRMELTYLKQIRLGNPVAQRIVAKLFPSYVLPNVFFQPVSGDSVIVNPAGELKINKVGKTLIHIIPSQNTSIYQTVEIEVVNPSMRKVSGSLRLLSGGRLRKV